MSEVCGCNHLSGGRAAHEADPGEFVAGAKIHPQPGEYGARIWHQALAARFIDRGNECIGDDNMQAALPQGDGRGETGRPTAHNQCIARL